MATQAVEERNAAINRLVGAWERRRRWQRSVLVLPYTLVPGLAAGIVMLLIARVQPWLNNDQLLVLTALLVLVGVAVIMGFIWLRPLSSIEAARRFDLMFDLDERISTALELLAGRIHTNAELTNLQLEDAWTQAQTVQVKEKLPLMWDWRGWMGVIVLLVALVILFVLPTQSPLSQQAVAQQAAISDAQEELRRITQDVAADANLTAEDREDLLEEIEQAQAVLQEPDVRPEEALAAVSEVQSMLEERSQQLQQDAAAQRAALEQVADTLRDASSQQDQMQQIEQEAGQGQQNAAAEMQQIMQQLDSMTESERQAMADALERAADQLEATNPAAADALRRAAEALRQGDTQAAQQAMQEAMQEMQSQQQSQQQTAEQLDQAAQQMQQAGVQIAQADQQPGEGEQMMQPMQQAGDPQDGDGSQGSAGQQGDQGDQSGEGNQAGDQGGEGQPGGQQGSQGADADTAGGEQSGTGAGAGDGPGDAGSDELGGSPQMQSSIDGHNPDGQGEGEYAEVYAPRRIGGEGGEQLFLEPDDGDVPFMEVESMPGQEGQALVPYSEVFSDYSDAALRSLEADYIPLGLRDVVRDYFSSLEPGRGR